MALMDARHHTLNIVDVSVALKSWADDHGKCWKSKLLYAWETGCMSEYTPYRAELQQIRNDLGPKWLKKYKLPNKAWFVLEWEDEDAEMAST